MARMSGQGGQSGQNREDEQSEARMDGGHGRGVQGLHFEDNRGLLQKVQRELLEAPLPSTSQDAVGDIRASTGVRHVSSIVSTRRAVV